MTCPDWRLLSSLRDRDPDAWERGLEHFDDCDRCREQALAEAPTLMFRRLPAPAVGRGEIAAMKQAVAVLRRSNERRAPAVLRRSSLLRAAALAALVIGAAALQGVGREPYGGGETLAELAPWSSSYDRQPAGRLSVDRLSADRLSVEQLSVEDLPLIEAVDPSYGSVVQVVDDEISLILVLPPNDV